MLEPGLEPDSKDKHLIIVLICLLHICILILCFLPLLDTQCTVFLEQASWEMISNNDLLNWCIHQKIQLTPICSKLNLVVQKIFTSSSKKIEMLINHQPVYLLGSLYPYLCAWGLDSNIVKPYLDVLFFFYQLESGKRRNLVSQNMSTRANNFKAQFQIICYKIAYGNTAIGCNEMFMQPTSALMLSRP